MRNKISLLTPILLMSLLYGNVKEARADTVESIPTTQMVNSVDTETPPPETPTIEMPPPETPTIEIPPPETLTTETPTTETPTTETPTTETPTTETPTTETPTTETPTTETPTTEIPTTEIPTTDTPTTDTPTTETPTTETPTTETPTTETPTTETPTTENPTTETPTPETPTTENPTTETPTPETPTTENPTTETPTPETPTTDTLSATALSPTENIATERYEDLNVWVSGDGSVFIRNTGDYAVVTYKAILNADTTYTVKSLGSGNDRFRIAVMNSTVSLTNAGDAVLVDRVINLDNSLIEYTFHNLNGSELYVYLSNYANPLADISVSLIPTEPEILSTVRLEGTNVFVSGDNKVYIRDTGDYPVVTYKATLEADTTYTVKSLGSGNDRFRIAVMNSAVSLTNAGDAVLVDRVINLDNSLTEYTFHNLNGVELYVYLSNYANPLADISVSSIPTEPEILSAVRLEGTNVYVPGDGNVYIQNTGDYAVVTYTAAIEANTTYTVKSLGSGNDRFRIVIMNSLISLENAGDTVLADKVINLDNSLTEFTFRNLEGVWLYVYLSSYENPASKVEITKIANQVSYSLEISAVTYPQTDDWNIYPTLFGVKTSNAVEGQQPQTIGWLYYSGYQILYAEGNPTNMVKIADWDSSLAYEGYDGPENYSPYMTPDGDIIFVFRGEQLAPLDYSYVGILEEARQNPIIYPAYDYDNPFVIDFGDSIKPTSWLQNSGADFVYAEDFFIFAEYTRPIHEMSYVWKVTVPFDDPENWRIVKEFEVSGSYTEGFEHGHSVSYDPYSGVILLTVGDDNDSAKIYQSDDLGENWVVVVESQEKYARLLNFVYTENKVYWGSDSGLTDMHAFLSVNRNSDGTPNFDSITEIYNFGYVPGEKATYTTAYISDPNGLLFLDRFDSPTNMPLEIMFWSFETNSMYTVAILNSLEGEYLTYGFRNEAVNWYASANDNLIVAGFGFHPNEIEVLGNSFDYSVNNLVLKVTKITA